jgi:hypothetical protein
VVVVSLLNKVVNYFDSKKSIGIFKIKFSSFRYLKEIGYVDTIIDIRSTAVKKLLGIKSETNFNGNNNNNTGLNGDIKPTNESKR